MFKKDCGFRKLELCKFKEEDCLPEKCDMHDIPFTSKGILAQLRKEKKAVKNLTNKMITMKKSGKHKDQKDEYEKIKLDRNDKVYGLLKLGKAWTYCKRIKK